MAVIKFGHNARELASCFSDSDRTTFEHGALCPCLHFISLIECPDAESLLSMFLNSSEVPFWYLFVLDVWCSAAKFRQDGSLRYANFDFANLLLVLADWIITLQWTWTPLSINLQWRRICPRENVQRPGIKSLREFWTSVRKLSSEILPLVRRPF